MADNLPINFPEPPPRSLASYDFFDLFEGTGIIQFYPFSGNTSSSTTDYLMTTNSGLYSAGNGITSIAPSTIDLDFDVTFNLPKIVEGTAYVSIPVSVGSAGAAVTANYTAAIVHFDGTTETVIGTGVQCENVSATGGNRTQEYRTVIIELTTKKFKAGDILRLNITSALTGTHNGSWIGHSPVGTQGGSGFTDIGTRAILFVPFRIDS